MKTPFEGKTVVISGAGRGIGRCIAESYARLGASVVLAEKEQHSGQDTANHIAKEGGKVLFLPTDVRDPENILQTVRKTVQAFGGIDVLVNNAGVSFRADPLDLSVDAWDDILHTNLRSVFLFSRAVAPLMSQAGGGAIVNIASTRALMSEPNSEAYAASKGGIISLTHALAISFSSLKIRVNCISPGWIETGDYQKISIEDHLQHPAQRVGKPEDVARACQFLTDPQNDFISGENLVIDGGMTRKMIYLSD
jgi:NAD(P)-dependent dehydrogenase (short-subunit alcohol dehydrogenase family)